MSDEVDVEKKEKAPKAAKVNLPKLKLIMRYLSKSGKDLPEVGAFSVDTTNAYISAWLNQGYKLSSTHSMGTKQLPDIGDEGYGFMFVLVME